MSLKYPTFAETYLSMLVRTYVTYDRLSESHELSIDDLPDHELYKLCGMIMDEDKERAQDATCENNPEYLETMLPALVKHMCNEDSKEYEREYTEAWRKGILSYFREYIKDLINYELDMYNGVRAA